MAGPGAVTIYLHIYIYCTHTLYIMLSVSLYIHTTLPLVIDIDTEARSSFVTWLSLYGVFQSIVNYSEIVTIVILESFILFAYCFIVQNVVYIILL